MPVRATDSDSVSLLRLVPPKPYAKADVAAQSGQTSQTGRTGRTKKFGCQNKSAAPSCPAEALREGGCRSSIRSDKSDKSDRSDKKTRLPE